MTFNYLLIFRMSIGFMVVILVALLQTSCGVAPQINDVSLDNSVGSGSKLQTVNKGKVLAHISYFPEDVDPDEKIVALIPDKKTSVRYKISEIEPPSELKSISELSYDFSDLIDSGSNSFEVKFRCGVCKISDNRKPSKELVVSSNGSNELVFEFEPVSNRSLWDRGVTPPNVNPGITLVFYLHGVVAEIVHTPINLGNFNSGNSNSVPNDFSTQAVSIENSNRSVSGKGQPDLSLNLVQNNMGNVNIQIGFVSERIKNVSSIYEIYKKISNTNTTVFETRFTSIGGLSRYLTTVYSALSCLTIAKESRKGGESYRFRRFLEKSLRSECKSVDGDLPFNWGGRLPEVAEKISEIGKRFYYRLFSGDLEELMYEVLVESERRLSTGKEPLKVSIDSAERLPIQLLIPNRPDLDFETPLFFGYVLDLAQSRRQRLTTEQGLKYGTTWESYQINMVFGRYRGFDGVENKDSLVSKAVSHEDALTKVIEAYSLEKANDSWILASDNKEGFLSNISTNVSELSLVWAYSHGQGRPLINNDFPYIGSSQKLIFGTKDNGQEDILIPYEVDFSSNSGGQVPFERRPLVVLIACESGVASFGGTSTSLGESFMAMGARGVITTEAEINDVVASYFGHEFLKNLVVYESPSLSLLKTRRALLKEKNNMWALLFHYQGDHGEYVGI